MRTPSAGMPSPAPFMVWSITDQVIEEPEIRLAQFRDLRDAGFGGIAAFVRCSRYSWDDPPARAALHHISDLCRNDGIQLWVGPDPRFVSHKLVAASGGLELLLFGNASRADVWPNVASVRGGRFTVRCELSPRHVHMLTEVAVEFRPLGLARVYAVRVRDQGVGRKDVLDISRHAHLFYNARDRYVEAFGNVSLDNEEMWKVLVFFHVRTNHVDFSNDAHLREYETMLARLKRSGCIADGIMWDEPGYTCTYGSLPYSARIRKGYRASTGRPLEADLWKLVYEDENGSHRPARIAYYRTVQNTITRAERKLKSASRRLWGRATVVGIHDTWHFESGDMCDMNHGSLDLWQTVGAKTGGFVDLGSVQQLKDPESPWYSQFAAMTVIAASLGKLSTGRFACNNLWTVGDDAGEGGQREALDHCVKIMALFGIHWLAHAYGPVGTIGQERTFLGSPPLPGYPDHSTWRNFPQWNRFLRGEISAVGGRLPASRLLVLFPVETMYALADARADAVAQRIFDLLLRLLDHHYHVDVLSTSSIVDGWWRASQFNVHGLTYDWIIYPFPRIVDPGVARAIGGRNNRVLYALEPPRTTAKGGGVREIGKSFAGSSEDILARLAPSGALRPVKGPERTWVTLTPCGEGTVVSVAPSRSSGKYSGLLEYGGRQMSLEETGNLKRVLFPKTGEPRFF